MNRDESIALFEKCEAARREVLYGGDISLLKNCEVEQRILRNRLNREHEAHQAAKAIWNDWANNMLAKKKRLKDEGHWEDQRENWWQEASVNFENCLFKLINPQFLFQFQSSKFISISSVDPQSL